MNCLLCRREELYDSFCKWHIPQYEDFCRRFDKEVLMYRRAEEMERETNELLKIEKGI